ncbi:hypothetical protein A1O3_06916 [Capronia epimyces CBS 606.96]|uniref:CENP-V/GFA domain-containing protein n=1 Tax=Capronia epimyces CBS 606.96 TaxID=1182542 RepID=W9XJD8_9EURO|nr:uncharacterized protein A1O3_06916 [Capronia epimyces CBS 606.96]EXJ80632.1 hypothetical protein A1O3_06916 [Capronia epimyces CBS 606.96]
MATPTHLTCLCALIYEPASLLSSSALPFKCCICHCNTCRRTTGALGTWYAILKGRPSDKSMSNTTAYKTSEKYTRFFCKQCGCNVFVRSERDGRWLACAGIVEIDDKQTENGTRDEKNLNVAQVEFHEYVGDARDGGFAPYLTRLGGKNVPCFASEPDDGAGQMSEAELLELKDQGRDTVSDERGEMMDVACHCGGVQLHIAPPAHNEKSEGWYVPQDRSKYSARLCCCRSCRLTLGFSLQPWTYIPPAHIFTKQGELVLFGPRAKDTVQIVKLKHYQSSDSVLRSFCSTCGATVFFQSFERPDVIDLSVGVVRSRADNARVEEWLQWDRNEVSMRHEAVDCELVEAWLGG